jgi:2-polyprenyl-6-methoxyphenol hydroxylase-like FAD-dependent oxidoreductase
MLLAKKGLRVLLVDKSQFPSDVIATHMMHPRGVSYLNRWGLLKRLLEAATPSWATQSVTVEGIELAGGSGLEALRKRLAAAHGWRGQELDCAIDRVLAPRRRVLDPILANAAAEAGAELRTGFAVEELLIENDRITGIRGRTDGGTSVTEKARIVVGADGRHSFVARSVKPSRYDERSSSAFCYYSYWSGVPPEHGDGIDIPMPSVHVRGRISCPNVYTNDGLCIMVTTGPREWFHSFRSDLEGNFMKAIEHASPRLAERARAGKREARFFGTAEQPAFFYKPYGPGWALVGDAGYQKDQCTAIGMTHAFRDAELLAEAIGDGLGGRLPMDQALADYEKRRNDDSKSYYEHVQTVAQCNPFGREQIELFAALRGKQEHINSFLAFFCDVVTPEEFFAPAHMQRIFSDARTDLDAPAILKNLADAHKEYSTPPWAKG